MKIKSDKSINCEQEQTLQPEEMLEIEKEALGFLFFGGIIVGSVVEYICSLGQEIIFGSRSWDYSHMPFNINGRICLLY